MLSMSVITVAIVRNWIDLYLQDDCLTLARVNKGPGVLDIVLVPVMLLVFGNLRNFPQNVSLKT